MSRESQPFHWRNGQSAVLQDRGQTVHMNEFAMHTAKALSSIDPVLIPGDVKLTIEQRVIDDDVTVDHYSLVISSGAVSVVSGAAPNADLTICQDLDTAIAMRDGEIVAQTAFLTGRLTIDGDIDKLLEHGALLGTLLGAVDA